MAMINASHLPTAIGIVHCRSQATDDSIVSKGNNEAYEAARAAAQRGLDSSQPPQDILKLQPTPPLSPPITWQTLSYLHQLFHPKQPIIVLFC